jgi:hypothetical protein
MNRLITVLYLVSGSSIPKSMLSNEIPEIVQSGHSYNYAIDRI